MPITHARDMVPPVRELIPKMRLDLVHAPIEDVYERDEKSGVLIRVGTTSPEPVLAFEPVVHEKGEHAGEPVMVESYETPGEDGVSVVTHEGSLIAQDTTCHDCGAGLRVGNDPNLDFYYIVCARLDERDNAVVKARHIRDGIEYPLIRLAPEECGTPYANSVLECGNAGPEHVTGEPQVRLPSGQLISISELTTLIDAEQAKRMAI